MEGNTYLFRDDVLIAETAGTSNFAVTALFPKSQLGDVAVLMGKYNCMATMRIEKTEYTTYWSQYATVDGRKYKALLLLQR